MKLTRLVALILCLAGLALCQTDQGRIVGAITDVNGAVIPSAKVLVKNQRTGIERSVTANEQGRYIITNLPPAQYMVSSTAAGLGTTEVEIVLTAAQERTVNLALQPAVLQQADHGLGRRTGGHRHELGAHRCQRQRARSLRRCR